MGRIDPDLTFTLFHNRLFIDAKIHHMFLNIMNLYPQQFSCTLKQRLLRQVDMPLPHRLLQRIKKTALNPIIRVCMYPYTRRDLIRRLESYTFDIVRKLIGILFQNIVYTHTIMLIYLCRKLCGYPVLLKIDHSFAHIFLPFHLFRDLPRFPLADPLDFHETLRFLLNDTESILFELFNDSSGKSGSYTFDRPRTQIPLNRHKILRLFHHMGGHLKLCPIYTVIHILSVQFQHLTFAYKIKIAHAGHFSIVIFQMEDCIAVLFIPIYNMPYISYYFLQISSLSHPLSRRGTENASDKNRDVSLCPHP